MVLGLTDHIWSVREILLTQVFPLRTARQSHLTTQFAQYGHNPYRQIKHLQPFVVVRSKAYSASSFYRPVFKVQLRIIQQNLSLCWSPIFTFWTAQGRL